MFSVPVRRFSFSSCLIAPPQLHRDEKRINDIILCSQCSHFMIRNRKAASWNLCFSFKWGTILYATLSDFEFNNFTFVVVTIPSINGDSLLDFVSIIHSNLVCKFLPTVRTSFSCILHILVFTLLYSMFVGAQHMLWEGDQGDGWWRTWFLKLQSCLRKFMFQCSMN